MQTFSTPGELSSEFRLLLACARKSLTPRNRAEAGSAIAGRLDWDLLRRHADRHGLSSLLYWHLQEKFPEAIPGVQAQLLNSIFEHNARRNLLLSAALVKILRAMRVANVRALAYKGPVLAMSLYGNLALREMSDVDLLIEPASFPTAREVLAGLGYQPVFAHTRKQNDLRLTSDCEYEFRSADGRVCLDVHWRIAPPHMGHRFDFGRFWERRRTFILGGEVLATFSPEDTVLVLAIHGGKHLWQRLCWLADFAECLREAPELDWQALLSTARTAHAERMLVLALSLAQDVMEVQLPAELAAQTRAPAVVQAIAASIRQNLFQPASACEEDARRWLTLLQLVDSRRDRIRSALRFALSSGPREWDSVRLPDSLFGFYPLVRIAHLARKAVSLAFPRLAAATDAQGRMEKT